MSNEDIELMNEFEKLFNEYYVIQYESDIFKTLDKLRNTGAGVRDVLELLMSIMKSHKDSKPKISYKGKAIILICMHIERVRTLEDLDDKLAFLGQDIAIRREETELSIDKIIYRMQQSSNPACQKIACSYLDNNRNLDLAVLEHCKATVDLVIEEQGEDFHGTSGRTGRGHI